MVGHCAVRWWAMGKRSLEQKIAGEDDIARMREIVREAMRGGALGFSTSRTHLHKTPDGEPVPGTFAAPEELLGIGSVLGEEGRGVFEAVPYLDSTDADVIVGEVDWMERVTRDTDGRRMEASHHEADRSAMAGTPARGREAMERTEASEWLETSAGNVAETSPNTGE